MNICFDVDDVLCDTYEIIMEASAEYHKHILKRDIPIRNVHEAKGDYYYFAKALQWSENELFNFYHEVYPNFLKLCKPYAAAITLIKYLKEQGHIIYILTAREERKNNQVYEITRNWLKVSKIAYDFIRIGEKNKQNYIKEHNIDIFVDDLWENCNKASDVKSCLVFHVRCNYNKNSSYSYRKNLIPITNIQEIKNICQL